MVKAKDFWNILCEEFNYRFFSGIPSVGLDKIYNKMNSGIMHYIPAASSSIALGLVNGVRVAGIKSALLLSTDDILKLDFSFNIDCGVPVFIISDYNVVNEELSDKFYLTNLSDDLVGCITSIEDKGLGAYRNSILFIGDGIE